MQDPQSVWSQLWSQNVALTKKQHATLMSMMREQVQMQSNRVQELATLFGSYQHGVAKLWEQRQTMFDGFLKLLSPEQLTQYCV